MTFETYRNHDALSLAEMVKTGQITAESLLEIAIARAEQVNPTINAIVHKLYDQARLWAKKPPRDAVFTGIPFLVKDLGPEVEGTPKCTGSRAYRSYVSAMDSHVTTKMKEAGLIIFGKTNTPELGLTPFTEPKLFGPTLNPWNTAHSPGGSSGGSGAAVAAGIVPMATANDGGGSIRIPASCCGLFGLKPSRGRVSLGPGFGEMWSGAVSEGCVSRSVRDSAAYLDAITGAFPGEPYLLQSPQKPYLQEVSTNPGTLRIAWSLQNTMGAPVHTDCEKALKETLALLKAEGHIVEEVALPYRPEDLAEAFITVVAGEVTADLFAMSQYLGRNVRPSDVEPETFGLYLLGKAFTAGEYAIAKHRWNEVSRRVALLHEQYDLFLTPTLPKPPIKTGELQSSATEHVLISLVSTFRLGFAMKQAVNQLAQKVYSYLPWTPFANMTGQPSMSVPLFWEENSQLPIGMMFTARMGEEDMLFRLAGQLEKAAPWFSKTPNL